MKKQHSSARLQLGKIKVASLSGQYYRSTLEPIPSLTCTGGTGIESFKIPCISQGAPVCSVDSCRF